MAREKQKCARLSRVPGGLAVSSGQADNGAVRSITRVAALAAALLCLFLPEEREFAAGRTPEALKARPAPEARIDINHATVEELLKVPGMTRSWAGRIIRFRPYHAKNDLLDHGIVTSQLYDRIKDYIIAHRDSETR